MKRGLNARKKYGCSFFVKNLSLDIVNRSDKKILF
jgi:hypothetical protein